MKVAILFLCLLFCFPAFCQEEQPSAQQKPVHSLGISIGINDFHFRDEYLSPHIFSSILFSSAISYQFKAKQTLHRFNATFNTGHPNSTIQPRNVTENIGSLQYTISRVFDVEHIAGQPLELSLGAGVSTFIASTNFNAIDQRYNYVWNEQSWYSSNSLNLQFGGECQISDHNNLSIQITLPMFRLVSRPEIGHSFNAENDKVIQHFLNVESQGKPEWFWQNAIMACELGYRHQIGKFCSLKLNYLFNYVTSDRPLPLQMYMNRVLVGFDFLF
jgi:hypothetical protein